MQNPAEGMIPTIHLNGDKLETLEIQALEAYSAVQAAIEKVSAAYPNGRNYYPQGPGAIGLAQARFDYHLSRLTECRTAFEALTMEIQAGGYKSR